MQARAILERLLGGETKVVEFDGFVGEDVPVHVTATCTYSEGAPGSLSNEPGWYVELDSVVTNQGERVEVDEPTCLRLGEQALRQFS